MRTGFFLLFMALSPTAFAETNEKEVSGRSTSAPTVPVRIDLTSSQRSRLRHLETRATKTARLIQRALESRRSSTTIRLLKSALRKAEKDHRYLGRLLLRHSGHPAFGRAAKPLRLRIEGDLISASLHLASSYSVRGSYTQAQVTVNRVLALDPSNSLAQAQRARIESAASEGVVAVGSRRVLF